jgi:hypothetical protein
MQPPPAPRSERAGAILLYSSPLRQRIKPSIDAGLVAGDSTKVLSRISQRLLKEPEALSRDSVLEEALSLCGVTEMIPIGSR